MTTIQKTTDPSTNQGVTQTAPTTSQTKETSAATGQDSSFDITLKALITPSSTNQVSEEELFSAIVKERIKSEKGEEGLSAFEEIYAKKSSEMKKADGYVPFEDITKAALIEFRDLGEIDAETTDTIYSQSFEAAQLDDNKGALFDGRGGIGDTTIAVATLEQALLSSRVTIEKYDSGELTASKRSVEEASNAKSSVVSPMHTSSEGGAAGFLFKPKSDSDGKLAVLLPSIYAGMAESMQLLSPNGEVIESGRYGGNGNGNREHFRFSQPGENYPAGVIVEATLTSGEKVRYTITTPSERTENIDPDSQAT